MKLYLPFLTLAALAVGKAEPLVTSWDTGISGQYARIYETDASEAAGNAVTTWNRGQGVQAMPTYAGVSEVAVTATDVYIRATGLGGHVMGPWYGNAQRTNLFVNYPANQAVLYRIPRDPGMPPANKTRTGLGRIGLFVDGVSMFDSRDAFSYDTSSGVDQTPRQVQGVDGDDVWNRDAFINEGVTFDRGNAHQAGSHYHYHSNPPGLRHVLGDSVDHDSESNTYTENFNGQHSPILGWVRDGYPIYGPYGYTNSNNPNSTVTRMRTGYRKRAITERTTLPAYAARYQGYIPNGDTSEFSLPVEFHGPTVTPGAGSQYEIGHYLEDYEYLGDVGFTYGTDFDLDEHNGRVCVTPEFPEGTYAYFVSIEANGTPKFPYNIGPTYYGTPQANTAAAIPADAEIIFEGGPEKSIDDGEMTTDLSNGDVTVTWSAIEGGTYVIERSSNLEQWEEMTAHTDRDALIAPDPAALNNHNQQFYRSTLVDVHPFDDSGFDVDLNLGPEGGNNILLLIVDDWGVDWCPIDNPDAPRLPEMPNLQFLADNGLRFSSAYAQAMCSPTRATLLTGRHPFRHGVGTPAGANIPENEFTLPDAFAAVGSSYDLISIGKWHLGGGTDGARTSGGWPNFSGANSNISDYWSWDKTVNGVVTTLTDTYATSDQVDDAVNFIRSRPVGIPWFCWIGFTAPHAPFHEPPSALLPVGTAPPANNRDRYEQMLEALDTEIGRLLDDIDLTQTNVILVGDNGTPVNMVQTPYTSGRGKGTLYEGGIRVPMVVAGPDVRARGTNDSPVHIADLYATVLSLAGIDAHDTAPLGTTLDSRDLYPALIGGQVGGQVVSEAFGNQVDNPGRAIREGDFKLIIFDDPSTTADTARFELYNLDDDPDEQMELLGQSGGPNAEQEAAYNALLEKNEALGGGFGDGSGGATDPPVSTGILSVFPNTAVAGTSLTVTFNFDPNANPGIPPLSNMQGNPIIPNATLGGIAGTNVNRLSRYVLQADVVLPNSPGQLNAEAIFPGPNRPTFGLTVAFEGTAN
ncbi:MAG: sulfatase-like hydrolase/transferase [Verrucomicrobiales bacterium]|nr:sulfatase-like hydrolase/transferase [Verrucomicrobiales bacterium]